MPSNDGEEVFDSALSSRKMAAAPSCERRAGPGLGWPGCSSRRRSLDGTSPPRDWLHAGHVGVRQAYTIESRGSPGTWPSCAGRGPLPAGEGGAGAAPRFWSRARGETCGVACAPALSYCVGVGRVPYPVAAFLGRARHLGQMSFPPSGAPHRSGGVRKCPLGPGTTLSLRRKPH